MGNGDSKAPVSQKADGSVPLITGRYFGKCQLSVLWGEADDLKKISWGGLLSGENMGLG